MGRAKHKPLPLRVVDELAACVHRDELFHGDRAVGQHNGLSRRTCNDDERMQSKVYGGKKRHLLVWGLRDRVDLFEPKAPAFSLADPGETPPPRIDVPLKFYAKRKSFIAVKNCTTWPLPFLPELEQLSARR